jgi:hypothetical protein
MFVSQHINANEHISAVTRVLGANTRIPDVS